MRLIFFFLFTSIMTASNGQSFVDLEPMWLTNEGDTTLSRLSMGLLVGDEFSINNDHHLQVWGDHVYVLNTVEALGNSGGYLECRNRLDGGLQWAHSFNHFNMGRREVPLTLEVDSSQITVLGLRRSGPLFSNLWNMGSIIKRQFSHDGALLRLDTFDLSNSEYPDFFVPLGMSVAMRSLDDRYLIANSRGGGKQEFSLINSEGTVDKFYSENFTYDSKLINRSTLFKDDIVVYHQELDSNFFHQEAYLKVYNSDLDSILTIDITDDLPKRYRSICNEVEDGHLKCYSFQVGHDTIHYTYFDQNFNKIWSRSFWDYLVIRLEKIPNKNEYLYYENFVVEVGDSLTGYYKFSHVDDSGQVRKLKTFETSPGEHFLANSIHFHKDQLFISGVVRGPDEDGLPDRLNGRRSLFAIDLRDIGLVTATDEEDYAQAGQLILAPNPCTDLLFIKGDELPVRYDIIDMMGHIVASSSFDGGPIPVDHLANSYYLLRSTYADGRVLNNSFVKQ